MTQTIYERLLIDYHDRVLAFDKFAHESIDFASQFSVGLKAYCGISAPTYFIEGKGNCQYVSFFKMSGYDDPLPSNVTFEEVSSSKDAIYHRFDDSSFYFGVGFVFEGSSSGIPSAILNFPIECKRHGTDIEVEIAGSRATSPFIPFTSNEMSEIYELVVEKLDKWVKERPLSKESLNTMGFQMHSMATQPE